MERPADVKETIKKNKAQLAFVFVSFFLMVLTGSFFSSRIVEKQLRSDIVGILSVTEMAISHRMNLLNNALENVASFMQYRLDNGVPKKETFDDFQELSGVLLRQLSGQFSLSRSDLYGYVNGEFISRSERAAPDVDDPMELLWYREAMSPSGYVLFAQTGDDGQSARPVITAARRLRGWYGNSYGVIAIDMDASIISQGIESLNIREGSHGWLLDSDFTVLASTSAGSVGRRLNVESNLKDELTGNDSGELTVASGSLISGDNRAAVFNYKRILNGWYLVMTTPTESYYRETLSMTATLSGLGLTFMLILGYLLIQLSMAKERSEEENKSKSSFLAKMSHEIRTPMNSILSMSELILRKNLLPESGEYLGIINHSARTLLSIINDILDFSKIESGRLEIENRKYHFPSMINDLINVIRLRLTEKQICFFVRTDPDIPEELIGDDVRVRQIVSNLLTNAVKYTEKGFISLDVRIGSVDGQSIELVFEVKDSGVGIKRENIDKLFVEFYRFGKNQSIEGTGLGLVIARAYCERMGGRISVESEYRRGSTFTATLVQSFENGAKSAFVEHPEKIQILVFEPNQAQMKSMADAMASLGLKPSCASSQAEFMEKLKKDRYDYAFVSSKHAMDCMDALGNEKLPTQLVVMIEIGDISTFKDVNSVMLPTYSISIANVLNDVWRDGADATNTGKQFSAPGAKVLVVDDFQTNLKVAKEVISHFGLTVDTCLSGKEAIELVQRNTYDIVFMDHMMPEMDGLETTAEIRALGKKDEYFLTLPIIALTANAIAGQREMFIENGMDDFIAKPIEMNKLVGVMKKWLPKEKQIEFDANSDTASEQSGGFRIEGIDIPAGLRNTGGSLPVYKDILLDFCRDANDVIIQLKKAEQEEDMKNCAILAHSIKGASRSVGANDLAQFAAMMEANAKNGNMAVLHSKINALWENARLLIDNIYAGLAMDSLMSEEGAEGEAPKIQAIDLERMKEALGKMDIETVNAILVRLSAMPLDAETKSLISEIEQDVLLFEYDMAVEKIDRLL
ncbi:MAG: response regulator [Synergistaceae bacterium]|jgi:signal transduction histidine kinase/CheY-like chemotaxis protein|nr:response regulator [Synergistaceae bacterium]